jgi:hypothetical protein
MGLSDRRRVATAKKKAAKEARMRGPKRKIKSKYALKRAGIYQPGSPYVTGNWGVLCRKLRDTRFVAEETGHVSF